MNTPLSCLWVCVNEDIITNDYGIGFRCDLKIVSDANIFFIETILKHHGVWNCFSEIICNPSHVKEGSLNICPYHDYLKSSHGCNLCPPNMCKAITWFLNIYLLNYGHAINSHIHSSNLQLITCALNTMFITFLNIWLAQPVIAAALANLTFVNIKLT